MPSTPRRSSIRRLTDPLRAALGRRGRAAQPQPVVPSPSTPNAQPSANRLRADAAVEAYEAGLTDLAWQLLGDVPRLTWARHAMRAYVHTGLAHDRDHVLTELRALAEDPSVRLKPRSWYEAVGPVFALGDGDLARALYARLDDEVSTRDVVADRVRDARDWMRDWIQRDPTSPSAPAVEDGAVSFAVLAYGHPGRRRASANIGDHVQSLASLGHVVRHSGVTFTGEKDLAEVLTELQGRVPARLRVEGESTRVEVVTADRDASSYAEIPPNTWTLAFGWYMHALFDTRYGFPLHANLLPLFVSFHCNKRDLLTPEAAEYLRRHGPIGCRDWATVDILLSMGVPAFFSGCMTTTVSTVFPEHAERPRPQAPPAYVDVPEERVPKRAVVYRHSNDAIRTRSFVRNLRDATDLLETYRSRHRSMVTSRLHAYLPARSLGLDVDFVPANFADPRFEGLAGIDDAQFDAIRSGLMDLLGQVVSAILSGAPSTEVYALWRTLTTDRVLEAERRRLAPPTISERVRATPSVVDVSPLVGPEDATPAGELVVPVSAAAGPRAGEQVRRLLASVASHTDRPLRVTLLGAGAASVDLEALRPLTSSLVSVRAVTTDASAVEDVLAIADLLPDVDHAVLVPADAVVHQDLGALFDVDLGGGHLFAAPTALQKGRTSGFGVIEAAAVRVPNDPPRASELRRVAFQAHAFDFDAFEVDVLVLDVGTMRGAGFAETALERAETFGLGLRETLHLYAGLDRGVVPAEWAVDTRLRPEEGAALTYGG